MFFNKAALFFIVVATATLLRVPAACAAEENAANGEPTSAYLAAYFWEKKDARGKEDSQLYYAIARDGFRFADAVNDRRPIVAATVGDRLIRDPMLLRDPDGKTFHLVATNAWKGRSLILFDSTDLVHWENQRLVQIAPERADKTWAPEMLWDPETRQFVVYWTSSLDNVWDTAAIWYATSTDLKTFSTPKVLMREEKGCLDADILYANGKWHMVYRYLGIWMRMADHALGPYEKPVRVLDLDVEGPFMFPINGKRDQWAMVFDYFGGNQGRWGVATSSDWTIGRWRRAKIGRTTRPTSFCRPGCVTDRCCRSRRAKRTRFYVRSARPSSTRKARSGNEELALVALWIAAIQPLEPGRASTQSVQVADRDG